MNVSEEEISLFSSKIQSYGIDEAGRGPYAGPLSVALVSYSWTTLQSIAKGFILKELDDSKKISEKQRESLYLEILKFSEIVRHTFISSKWIDTFGISYSFLYAVQKLTQNLPTFSKTLFLIDGKYSLKNFSFSNPNLKEQIQFVIKGDSKFVNIASASIIAKVKRDRLMKLYGKKYPFYRFEKNKGYPTKQHQYLIQKHGLCKIHRKTFLKKLMLSLNIDK